ncbi:MAG TPA: carbon-nitrogen hydrolase family protein [Polyangiaceae bacterium LLY-WYZ-15_(1-7)]|nr:hydrolase [Sandaracinus sp.]HJL02201.1 carbon-nitrogen hydrolase family protein [Polyangiaceae bacterium LLY-WYZ-15_(1-7)]MBJ69844.1 hydrolase [Sandaracinus sp.]HJL13281.1 carbon-nitrogen hydrolase family protein [Polyangiaceae bacterium LLY-WYZ-15_(1-7)]HJL25392.1 carbon-nitrogen hydrolase family protein [Polyangiaceae bacterium LLY-WYZ-15_(1-7)]
MRVGVLQLTSNDEVDRNLEAVERTTAQAVREGAELVVVPECFAHLGREEGKLEIAEALPEGAAPGGPILERCRALAREHGVELVLGGFWEKHPQDPGRAYNACVHLAADGSVGAVYRKIHLFDVELSDGTTLRESETVAAGEAPVVADTVAGKLGLTVCYDVRFPELYRRLVDLGATAVAVPAAFTLHTGKDHWHVLLRARAIESQCYVLAAAQTGRHVQSDGRGRRVSYGHALIADPWGTVLAECGEGEGCAVATLDPAYLEKVRATLPSLRHRKL